MKFVQTILFRGTISCGCSVNNCKVFYLGK